MFTIPISILKEFFNKLITICNFCLVRVILRMLYTEKKIPIKITVLAQYSCGIFIFLFILYCRIVKNMVYHISNKFTNRNIKFHTQYHIFDYSTI